MQYFIGVDPGSPVTLAFVNGKGSLIAYSGENNQAAKIGKYMTNVPELFAATVEGWVSYAATKNGSVIMAIENVGPMPGEGIASAARFAGSVWMARTAAVCFKVPYVMVAPTTWKKHFGLSSDKEGSRAKACQLWPKYVSRFRNKKDHNYAEAALIAKYVQEVEYSAAQLGTK